MTEDQQEPDWIRTVNRTEIAGSEQSAGTPGFRWALGSRGKNARNFALYSKHAEQVTLLLYGTEELTRPGCPATTSTFADTSPGRSGTAGCRSQRAPMLAIMLIELTGRFRAGSAMHAFDGQKLLVDPYARSIYFPPGFDREAARQPFGTKATMPLALLHA
ncbi:MAG: hypothetical protein R3C49_06240 [Planctomycetaceae bacterium]